MDPFALLDDCHATSAQPTSRLYTGWSEECRCDDPRQLDRVWDQAERAMRAGRHAVVVADYEWGARLQQAGDLGLAAGEQGALRLLLFDALQHLSSEEVESWLAEREAEALADCQQQSGLAGQGGGLDPAGQPSSETAGVILPPAPAGIFAVRPSLGADGFSKALERIQALILAGETYQVNFSYRLDCQVFGSPFSLYRRLRASQPVPFGALIALPPWRPSAGPSWVLSCSPELFLRHRAGRLQAKPMKGTASRAADPATDAALARQLATNAKTRAENLMIVDLLRNDLGRLARTGSVRVPALFDLEAHPSLWQMTSTVEAELAPEVRFPRVLRATFPCGSITGAPKLRTMHWIRALETRPRGLYTGAIGWIDPPPRGDFCLSVAIRTLTLEPLPVGASPLAPRQGTLGIGAGIVSDSEAADEYAECQLKARFITGLDPGFSLFETLYATRGDGIRHLDRHLARLGRSAEALGFDLPLARIRAALTAATDSLPLGQPGRLKLELHKDGRFTIKSAPLEPLAPGPVKLLIAPEPMDEADPLLGHKTSRRARYDAAIGAAVRQGAFDMLFRNRRGQLTEGARTNLFVQLDGVWLTPPLSAGVLPGVQRGLILDDPAWAAREAPVTLADLLRADQIRVTNALRGVLEARLESEQAPPPRP